MNAPLHTPATQAISELPLSEIHTDFENSRRRIDADALATLKESISAVGLLQPLVVAPRADSQGYTLIAGFTRLQALQELGIEKANVSLMQGTEAQLMEAHIAENVNRADLSLVSSVIAVKRLATKCSGDYEEVGRRLGLTAKQLADRLALAKCSESVLDALEDDKIRLGHAIVLSDFGHKLQDATLEKIIEEGLSVEALKERAGKAKVKLTIAKFDTSTDCVGCPHNSDSNTQSSLFDVEIEKGVCSNTQCFGEKQDAWLKTEKYRLKDDYGVLIDTTTVDPALIRLVDVTVVGEEQHTACLSCAHNVAILDNRPKATSFGAVRDQVCNNAECFDKCAAAEVARQNTAQSIADAQVSDSEDGDSGEPTPQADKPSKPEKPALASALQGGKQRTKANSMFAKAVFESYCIDEPRDQMRLIYLAVQHFTGQGRLPKDYSEFMALDADAMKADASQMLMTWLQIGAETETEMAQTGTGMQMLHELGLMRSDATDLVTRSWTSDALEGYPKHAIAAMLEESGFAQSYDAEHGEGRAKALSSLSKGEMLKSIEGHDFDWSGYAPASYTNTFKAH